MIQHELLQSPHNEPYLTVLKNYADNLELAYKDKIDCKVKTKTLEGVKFWIFTVQPYGRTGGIFEMLQVREPIGSSQAVIETFHLSENLQLRKIDSEHEFAETIKQIFEHPRTAEIVRLISEDAIAEKMPERSFLIAEMPFETSHGDMAHVSILGVSGFLSIKTLTALAKEPDIHESAYQGWDGRFVATMMFEGAVKVTLTREEMTAMQKIALKTLNNAKG